MNKYTEQEKEQIIKIWMEEFNISRETAEKTLVLVILQELGKEQDLP